MKSTAGLFIRILGEENYAKEVENIPNEKVRNIVIERLKLISDGQRDFKYSLFLHSGM